jgi:hypothetical protein
VPESLTIIHTEVQHTAHACNEAVLAGNSELANQYWEKLRQLCQQLAEGTGKPTSSRALGLPESLAKINNEIRVAAHACNKATEAGNTESAKEHSEKIKGLLQNAKNEAKNHDNLWAWGVYNVWVSIQNKGSRTLRNAGHWNVRHGWFNSDPVGDIPPHGAIWIEMSGDAIDGVECTAYFKYDNQSAKTLCWWECYDDENLGQRMRVDCWSPGPKECGSSTNQAYFAFSE